ncbi:MAG: Slp family lipoprotein [Nitrospira sp.]|nr:Slp family lipoprotein [Nitrospira sp.]
MMCVCRYLAIGLLVVTAGCASTRVIPESLEPQVEKTVSFDQIVASPDSYRGKVVLLGGEVLKAKATEGGT